MALQTSGRPYDSAMERVLQMNIVGSEYYKELNSIKSHYEVIDEIYNQVEHVEPWMSGNARGSSTAFCLLYKLFTLQLNIKQVQELITHEDSPYIRAVGFLYLRYIADPKTLWDWFEPYLEDDEKFAPGINGKMVTMGLYIRDLLLELYYFDTIFPRIPVPVARQITSELETRGLPTKGLGAGGAGGKTTRGAEGESRRPPSVKAALSVAFGQRAPHRSGAREAATADRVRGSSARPEGWEDVPAKVRDRSRDTRDKDRSPLAAVARERSRDRKDEPERSGERRGYREKSRERRERSPEVRGEREKSRERRDDRERGSRRERERSRDGREDRERVRERSRERRDNRDRERRRERSPERRSRREDDRGRDRSRERRVDQGKEAKRERSRDRQRDRSKDRKEERGRSRRDRSRERDDRHKERHRDKRRKEREGGEGKEEGDSVRESHRAEHGERNVERNEKGRRQEGMKEEDAEDGKGSKPEKGHQVDGPLDDDERRVQRGDDEERPLLDASKRTDPEGVEQHEAAGAGEEGEVEVHEGKDVEVLPSHPGAAKELEVAK